VPVVVQPRTVLHRMHREEAPLRARCRGGTPGGINWIWAFECCIGRCLRSCSPEETSRGSCLYPSRIMWRLFWIQRLGPGECAEIPADGVRKWAPTFLVNKTQLKCFCVPLRNIDRCGVAAFGPNMMCLAIGGRCGCTLLSRSAGGLESRLSTLRFLTPILVGTPSTPLPAPPRPCLGPCALARHPI
jgi:hypothetical protein